MAVSKNTQALIDKAVAEALAEAQKGLVTAASKPDLVPNLRKTWRKTAEHGAEQLARFARLFVLSAIPVLVDFLVKGSGHFDWETLLFALVPVGETVYRQVFPALGANKVDSADGVTIVPSQVGAQTVDIPVNNAAVEVPVGDGGGGGGDAPPDMAGMDDPGGAA